MVRLDASALRYMGKDEFRVLAAVEQGMRNHELVPVPLIVTLAGLRLGGAHKLISELLRNKLVSHNRQHYDGYSLTYEGYDYLALKAMSNRESVMQVGSRVGVGKESDIYEATNAADEPLVLKFQRLGRTSFRTVKTNRDYHGRRKHASWLYLSRLAALKEYAYLKALHENGFPVPEPLDHSRHCVLMRRLRATTLNQVRSVPDPGQVYATCMNLIVRFARYGLIHCDFNEFNLMIDDDMNVFVIDFPQMVSTSHLNAREYFNRDVECVRTFFRRRFGFESDAFPVLEEDGTREFDLDVQVAASGFTPDKQRELDELVDAQRADAVDGDEAEIDTGGVAGAGVDAGANDGAEGATGMQPLRGQPAGGSAEGGADDSDDVDLTSASSGEGEGEGEGEADDDADRGTTASTMSHAEMYARYKDALASKSRPQWRKPGGAGASVQAHGAKRNAQKGREARKLAREAQQAGGF